VGLATAEGQHFVFDRATGKIQEVTEDLFVQKLAGAIGIPAREETKGIWGALTVTLTTSSGQELTTQDAYGYAYGSDCEDSEHSLSMNGAPIEDHVNPFLSVSCAEIVGNQLWLGTRYDGEYGHYPAEGIVVQSLDNGQLVKRLRTNEGLTDDYLIRAIRLDPFGKTVWVSTNQGINEVDQEFRVRRKLFFYHELDPETGSPTVGLSSTKRTSDPLLTKCFGKYAGYGLIDGEWKQGQVRLLLEQEKEALERMRGSRDYAAFQAEFPVIEHCARCLKQAGELRGMELINEYFRAADLGWKEYNSPEVPFYNYVALSLGDQSELIPAMLEGLYRIRPYQVREGCGFFDMRWSNRLRRFDAKYAEALLLATERERPHQLTMPPGTEDFCAEAFKSQLGNPDVHQAFFKDIFPKLTASQQALADELSKEPPAKLQ